MKKEERVGFIGEKLFVNFLKRNRIQYVDLRDTIINKRTLVSSVKTPYFFNQKLYSHPFDFIINGMNIEIKSSTIHKYDNKFSFCWNKNDYKNIDYVIGLVINSKNRIKDFLLFDKKYINSHPAFSGHYKSKFLPIIHKKELTKLLTAIILTYLL